MIKHAFVVCAYKESEYLEECVKSLIEQTVRSPIAIATSTPNDHISSIADKYSLPVYVRNGQSDIQDDWNFAAQQLESEWITIAHQDDVYDKRYVEVLTAKIDKMPSAVMAMTDYRPIIHGKISDDRNCRIKRFLRWPLKFRLLAQSRFVRVRTLSHGNCMCCPSVSYHRSVIDGPIFTSDLKFSLDWDTFLKFAKMKGGFAYVAKPLTYYRIHNEATTMDFIRNNTRVPKMVLCSGSSGLILLLKYYSYSTENLMILIWSN